MQTAVTNMTKQRMLQKKNTLIDDLPCRMPQHTSSEVTVGYNTPFVYHLGKTSNHLH